jgi:hypothetical protein
MIPPSILSHGFGGAILIIIFVSVAVFYSKLQNLDIYRGLILLSLFSIVVTLHGISHLGLEREYNYIPFYSWNTSMKNKSV